MEKCDEIRGLCGRDRHRRSCAHGVAPSSYDILDSTAVFRELGLRQGQTVLDAGCGKGDYALRAACLVGRGGTVHAFDVAEQAVSGLKETAAALGIGNVEARVADISSAIPLPDDSVDVCFLFTVLHMFDVDTCRGILERVRHILRPDGVCAVLECKKENTATGPPMHMRMACEELVEMANISGFDKLSEADLADSYLVRFGLKH